MVELPEHPWFIGCQFHPEYTSNPRDGHPLFTGLISAALAFQANRVQDAGHGNSRSRDVADAQNALVSE